MESHWVLGFIPLGFAGGVQDVKSKAAWLIVNEDSSEFISYKIWKGVSNYGG
jgi:hypothetical protein